MTIEKNKFSTPNEAKVGIERLKQLHSNSHEVLLHLGFLENTSLRDWEEIDGKKSTLSSSIRSSSATGPQANNRFSTLRNDRS